MASVSSASIVISDSGDDSDFVVETPPTVTKTKAMLTNLKARKIKEKDDGLEKGEKEKLTKVSTAITGFGQKQQQQDKSSFSLASPDFNSKSKAFSAQYSNDSLEDSPVVATAKKIGAAYRKSRVILSDSEEDSEEDEQHQPKDSSEDEDEQDEQTEVEEEDEDEIEESEEEEDGNKEQRVEESISIIDLSDNNEANDSGDDSDEEEDNSPRQSEFLPETSDASIVSLDTTEDEVIREKSEDELVLSPEEADDLRSSLARNQRALQSNLKMLGRKDRLPDGGAKLQKFVDKLLGEQDDLQSKLSKAKVSRRSDGLTSNDSSRSSISPPSQLTAEQQKLVNLKERRRILRQQFSLVRPSQLADSGASLRREISQIDMQILKLEGITGAAATPFIPLGERYIDKKPDASTTANKGPLHNEEWQKFRDAIGAASVPSSWEPDMEHHNLYGGRMNMQRRQEAVKVTTDALKNIHKSLETMPAEGDEEEDPEGLRSNVTLMGHQKQALAWLMWREEQQPCGGILADDMGLGKTLTMISLILKHKEIRESKARDKDSEKENEWLGKHREFLAISHGTLVVCPASLLGQWEGEVKKRLQHGALNVLVYHGANRGRPAKSLARFDVVITTYGTVMSEMKSILGKTEGQKLENMRPADEEVKHDGKNAQLAGVVWERIILDEAHQVRNPRSQTARAVTALHSRRRWAVTGTPIQNKELDMYSLVRFLRCRPFDEYRVWKLWVDNKTSQGQTRMNTLIRSLLLRRTKATKNAQTGADIVKLPPKEVKEHEITLSDEEKQVYDEVFSFSQNAMMTYMRKHMEKEEDKAYMTHIESGGDFKFRPPTAEVNEGAWGGCGQGAKRLGPSGKEVKAHHLLVLLLRLRQICCHPGLIKSMIDSEARSAAGAIDEGISGNSNGDEENDDLVSQLADMSLTNGASDQDEEVKSVLNMDNPVFKEKRESSKITKVVEELTRLHDRYQETGVLEKAVVVSQWTSMLEIVKKHVERVGLKCTEINGKVPVKLRGDIVTAFNRKGKAPHVMLLSLAAGGVGLNLVGANHLFLLDMHWNPQLEQQACDRIYRVGQTREVTVHRFLCQETVEARIKDLQRKKLDLADGVLTGAKRTGANKLTMDDLKMLFNVQ